VAEERLRSLQNIWLTFGSLSCKIATHRDAISSNKSLLQKKIEKCGPPKDA